MTSHIETVARGRVREKTKQLARLSVVGTKAGLRLPAGPAPLPDDDKLNLTDLRERLATICETERALDAAIETATNILNAAAENEPAPIPAKSFQNAHDTYVAITDPAARERFRKTHAVELGLK
jgi:hypothetical protein